MTNILKQVAKEMQSTIEENFIGETPGLCYLFGHCLAEVFNHLGLNSRKVTGKLAILMNSKRPKYVTYGRLNLKGKLIGAFHTWCEVTIDDKVFIVDPSLKANIKFIQKRMNIKINPLVEKDVLITNSPNTFHYKYYEDERLRTLSDNALSIDIIQRQIDLITLITLNKIQHLNLRKSA